jgi:SAM-dependent methyltransferase
MPDPWGANAERRHEQITTGVDTSYAKVLLPSMLRHLQRREPGDGEWALDIGCGTGLLSARLAQRGWRVVGIDPSRHSIEVAKRAFGNVENLGFRCQPIEHFASRQRYGLVVSNMSLQAMPRLQPALDVIGRCLAEDGIFVFSIPHPCFWVPYRERVHPHEYEGYKYGKRSAHRISFTISRDRNALPARVPYFHRSLEHYSAGLARAGLDIALLTEPLPRQGRQQETQNNWDIPHFLVITSRRR